MESCLYRGTLRHRRMEPLSHVFEYPLFMLYLDLDELPDLFDPHPLWSARRPAVGWFRRADHLGDGPLKQSVIDLVASRTGQRLRGPVRLLTHLRYFGYGFNPVSFYYCFDPEGRTTEALVAEINNTPWGEQHCYVIRGRSGNAFRKEFHVSPFMPMDLRYDWSFSEPGPRLGVHMTNYDAGRPIFDATLSLEREPISSRSLNLKLVAYPAMTARVIARIYWQALRLWWKGVPVHTHPRSRGHREEAQAR